MTLYFKLYYTVRNLFQAFFDSLLYHITLIFFGTCVSRNCDFCRSIPTAFSWWSRRSWCSLNRWPVDFQSCLCQPAAENKHRALLSAHWQERHADTSPAHQQGLWPHGVKGYPHIVKSSLKLCWFRPALQRSLGMAKAAMVSP